MLQRNFGWLTIVRHQTVVWLHLNIPISHSRVFHFGFIEILHDSKSLSQMNPTPIFQDEKTQNKQHEDFISNCSFVTFLEVFRTNTSKWFQPPLKQEENTTKQHKLHPNSSHHLMNFDFAWHLGQRCQAVGRTGGIGDLDFSRWHRVNDSVVFSGRKRGTKKSRSSRYKERGKTRKHVEFIFFWGGRWVVEDAK